MKPSRAQRWHLLIWAIGIGIAISGCSPLRTGAFNLTGGQGRSLESQLALAMLSEKHSDNDRAEELYQDLLIRDPKNVSSRRRLAIIATRNEKFEEANKLFQECVDLEPDNAELLNDFGYACYLGDDLQGAERHLKAATKLRSNFPSAWTNLGLVYAQQARFQECQEAFSRAADSPAKAHCNMAYVYAQSMQLELAKTEFSNALSLDPNCAVAAEGLMQVCKQIPGNEPKTIASTFGVTKSSSTNDSAELQMDDPSLFELQSPNSGTFTMDRSGKRLNGNTKN
jgi:Tfp pilus assembly protein PilF